MKQLAVCGDSWFSSHPDKIEQSVVGQLVTQHNFLLLSLARVGCSNFAIALQIDHAIKAGADFIIVGATTPDRIELPIINDSNRNIWARLRQTFTWKGWFDYQPGVYLKRRGLANVKYTGRRDLSNRHSFLTDPTIISESINNLAFGESGALEAYGLDETRTDALKSYMVHLYDTYVKRQYDSWIISDAIRRIQLAGIPFLLYAGALYDGEYIDDIAWVPRENLILPGDFNYYNLPLSASSISHLDTAESKIFADYITTRLKGLKFINE